MKNIAGNTKRTVPAVFSGEGADLCDILHFRYLLMRILTFFLTFSNFNVPVVSGLPPGEYSSRPIECFR